MRVKLEKRGEDLVLPIPAELAGSAELVEGMEVELDLAFRRLIVSHPRPEGFTFEEMCARVTEENRHGEIDTGPPLGNEAW